MYHPAKRSVLLLVSLLLSLFLLTACGGGSGEEPAGRCTISISCATILDNRTQLTDGKEDYVPAGGEILPETEVAFAEGESAFDLLQRVCRENGIPMESSWSPLYNSAYIEGIANLYEFDCGKLSGWMYCVNGDFPNYGCSQYTLRDGDEIRWVYTCDLGEDVGGGYAASGQ
mgnify:CR=1 FL=1